MLIGYARVSTDEQNTELQIEELKKAGCEAIYAEKVSGKNTSRTELKKMLAAVKSGDVVIVYKMDRMTRSLSDLLKIHQEMQAIGVQLRSLTEPIDTGTSIGNMLFQLLGVFAEFERNLILERTSAGVQKARDKGVKFGRSRAMSSEREAEAVKKYQTGKYTLNALAVEYGCNLSSIKRAVLRVKSHQEPQLF